MEDLQSLMNVLKKKMINVKKKKVLRTASAKYRVDN